LILAASCSSYKSNIMFQTKASSSDADWYTVRPFVIEPGDEMLLSVTPWQGEKVIVGETEELVNDNAIKISINTEGYGKFPLIGWRKMTGNDLTAADSILSTAYADYINEPFVQLKFVNKKISVIGTKETLVLPLENEMVRVSQVLALSGGLTDLARSGNIRILRNENVFVANLSDASTRIKNDIVVRPGDVIYVEPVRRPLGESSKDAAPAVSLLTNIITLAAIIIAIL